MNKKIKITSNQLNILKENMLMMEATASEIHQKYYPTISDEDFNQIVSADVISSNIERNNLGEYGKWLLNLYKNKQLKLEDLYKAKEYIPIFDKAKKSKKLQQPDINKYGSLADMFKVIEPFYGKEAISNTEITKDIKSKEADVVYEDSEWKVIVPNTEAAACLYGANTQWCTAAKENNMFDHYNEEGKLYININKKTGRKYQFHFESGHFMDERDKEIETSKIGLSDGLTKFYEKTNPLFIIMDRCDYIGSFFDGLAMVKLFGEWGFIDKNGREIIPFEYDDAHPFNEGFAGVKLNGKWGFIDTNGIEIIPFKYDGVNNFFEGFAGVKLNGVHGYIDKNNNWYDEKPIIKTNEVKKIKITKQQLVELQQKINLPPLVKKALVGEPIYTPTEAQQGVLINETPDGVKRSDDYLLAHWSSDDAIVFGFEYGKAYIGYNNDYFFDSNKISEVIKSKLDKYRWQDVEIMMTHAGVADFYTFLYGEDSMRYLSPHRSAFGYPGRLWLDKKIISFWQYPDKEKLPQLIKLLWKEINNIYNIDVDFTDFKIEIKHDEYVADLNDDDEDYIPDVDWQMSKKIGSLIPIKDFISSSDATEQEMQAIHLLPSDEKRNTPQMQSARDADIERLGDKFNGNVSQAEWNAAKKKYQGESKINTNKKLIKEDPDTVYVGFGKDSLHYDDVDAIPFGLDDDKMYVGYNRSLWSNISDADPLVNVYGENTHTSIGKFYDYLVVNKLTNNDITYVNNTDNFTFPGRLWTISKVVSFWTTPPPNRISSVLSMLKQELKTVYDYNLNIDVLKIEIDGKLIPIQEYADQNNTPEKIDPKIHLLPSDEKRNTPQMQAARDADAERLGNKFNGNVSQAEWNSAKKKYQGESKKIKITSNQLNEIKKYLLNEEITIPVTTGDTIMMGKFKNKKTVVKTIDRDTHGMPTINGKQATTFRTIKEELKNDLVLYHGTKHNFLKFETSNIGGGEGNQSFGWGIYFTDNKSVSEFYANLLGGDNGLVYTINVSNGNFMSWYGKLESDFCDRLTTNMLQNGITELPINRMLNNGKIEINKLPTKEAIEYYPNGKFLYENLALVLGGDKMASNKLNELGVDGVYYPIGQFLKKGDKSHANGTNYVLFSEDKIKIVNQEKVNVNIVNESIEDDDNELYNTKIVDDNGNPLKVYRAQKDNRTQGVDRSSNHKGIYFSADKNSVKIYGDNINEYFLNIKNPIILKDLEWNLSVIPEYLYNNLIEKGYDGAIWIRKGIMYEIVAFYENQVIPLNNNINEATESDVNNNFSPFTFFKNNETGMPFYDNIINGKSNDNKIGFDIIIMSPNAYFKNILLANNAPNYGVEKYLEGGVNKNKIPTIMNGMNSGVKYDIPVVDFRDGFQEGRHRALAARNLGVAEIPVAVFYNMENKPNILTEATESDVNLSSFKPKNELNEKFWINNKLKSVVRKRLLKIADDFIEFLKVDIKKVEDILFLGSLANYNWSSYSDVDLHLLVDFKTINKDVELIREYFESKKKLWNDEHDNLKIFGFPIELYVQDKNDENASVGVFSLEKNKWLKKPEIIDDKDFDKKKIKEKAAVIMTDIDDLLSKYKKKPSFNELNTISNKVKKLYDKIKKMRKVGLASEKGETSVGNIVFKVLRRNGYMEKLVDLKTLTYDKINSIK